jgi:hypothetical protein
MTKMKKLTIEWKHLARDGRTCDRCSDTGDSVREAVNHLNQHCSPKGVKIEFRETRLPASRIKESNAILLNGVPLEKVLKDTKAGQNRCGSCSDLLETETQCRTVSHGDETLEAIPAKLILQAACRVLDCKCSVHSRDCAPAGA